MGNYFSISEFFKQGLNKAEPQEILKAADIIQSFWIPVLNETRERLNIPIRINSGFRPKAHEISQGRSGNSQHTFKTMGAVDLSFYGKDLNSRNLDLLQGILIDFSPIKRIARYGNFIHVDHAGEKRLLFKSDKRSRWTLIREI